MRAQGLTPILNVSDIVASFVWFETLGWEKPWGVREMHLCHPDGHVFRISRGIGGH